MAQMLVPEEMLEHFDIVSIVHKSEEYIIRLEEKSNTIPDTMEWKGRAVLDGFCRPIELQTFPIKGEAVYVHLYRRRWKERGGGKRNYKNQYQFNETGMKATREFGAFLKEAFRD